MNLVLHPATRASIEHYLQKPSHALLVVGTTGAGKGTLARNIAAGLLAVEENALLRHPFFQQAAPVDNVISIDMVRGFQRFMRLKTTGSGQAIRRMLIVENAQSMTIEAQNAFLKLLEEPPADTSIIMTVVNQSDLLPTIRSRAQLLQVSAPTRSDLENFYTNLNYKKSDIDKAYYMSEGQAGLMNALVMDDEEHSLVAQIQVAKQLLSRPVYERLTMVDGLSKQRGETGQLLQALQLVCHAGLVQAAERDQLTAIKRWHRSLQKLTQAQRYSGANPNLKLLMTDLLLGL